MPRVDFYILTGDSDDARLGVACRLAEKAMQSEMRAWIRTRDAGESGRLDDLLWTFSQGSFVPHRVVTGNDSGDATEPVLVGSCEPPPSLSFGLLINLSETMPDDIERFARIAELVDDNAERRQNGRERYRRYRDNDCVLESHNLRT